MTSLPPRLRGLLNPDSYPHPVERVELMETHISWIVLTGPFAYKIKKPIDLGFVDYTSIESRRRFCHQELRLNRRLAPDLYLEVIAIVSPDADGGDLRLVCDPGDGNSCHESPIDHSTQLDFAVKMRQFEQSQLLSEQLMHGDVSLLQVDRLGRELADFHAQCEIADSASEFGSRAAFQCEVNETFDAIESDQASNRRIVETVTELRRWIDREFERLDSFFDDRITGGHIRACHGDLHCNNMLIEGGVIRVFDGIEFNEHFRWIDAMNDLAFAWMDLIDRDASHFAGRLLNCYLEVSGDFDGLHAWRLYAVNRALVRAKVSLLRIQQFEKQLECETRDSADAIELRDSEQEFQRYLNLATKIAHSSDSWLMITCGISGSGKSLFAQQLSDATLAVRIRTDVERKRLAGKDHTAYPCLIDSDLNQPLPRSMYAPTITSAVYQRLADIAAIGLQAGLSIVADGTFLRREQRDRLRRVAVQHDVPFYIAWLESDVSTSRERITSRRQAGDTTSDADAAVVVAQVDERETWTSAEEACLLHLDNSPGTRMEDLVSDVLNRLEPARS